MAKPCRRIIRESSTAEVGNKASFMPANFSTAMVRLRSIRTHRCAGPAGVKRASQSAFRSDSRNSRAGKASLIEHLSHSLSLSLSLFLWRRERRGKARETGTKRGIRTDGERRGGKRGHARRHRGKEEREGSERSAIIKVTRTPLNGSPAATRRRRRRRRVIPRAEPGRGCHGGFN